MPREEGAAEGCRERKLAESVCSAADRIDRLIGALSADPSDLDGERRDALEMRLYLGYYDLPDVRQEVAERLAASTAAKSAGCGGQRKKRRRSPPGPGQGRQKRPRSD